MTDELIIKNLKVNVEDKEILKGVNLTIKKGEVAALMGPNGSGKSTLAYTLMGHPKYEVTDGEITYKGKNVLELEPNERAKLGLFLSFQYPQEIQGVSVSNFLRTAYNAVKETPANVAEFVKLLQEKMAMLKIDKSFSRRYLNEGFSGGEKKRTEILQLAVLQPDMAILDETDSGLDIDSLKIVGEGVNSLIGEDRGFLLITHYQRLLDYIKPDTVHIMLNGKIVKSGGKELALALEEKGYDHIIQEVEGNTSEQTESNETLAQESSETEDPEMEPENNSDETPESEQSETETNVESETQENEQSEQPETNVESETQENEEQEASQEENKVESSEDENPDSEQKEVNQNASSN